VISREWIETLVCLAVTALVVFVVFKYPPALNHALSKDETNAALVMIKDNNYNCNEVLTTYKEMNNRGWIVSCKNARFIYETEGYLVGNIDVGDMKLSMVKL